MNKTSLVYNTLSCLRGIFHEPFHSADRYFGPTRSHLGPTELGKHPRSRVSGRTSDAPMADDEFHHDQALRWLKPDGTAVWFHIDVSADKKHIQYTPRTLLQHMRHKMRQYNVNTGSECVGATHRRLQVGVQEKRQPQNTQQRLQGD